MSESREPLPFAQKGAVSPIIGRMGPQDGEGDTMAATAQMLVYTPESAKG